MNADLRWQRLLDRTEIWDLLIAYASAVDRRDWARWGSLLIDDVELSLGAVGSVRGRDAVVAFAAAALADIDATQHLITSPEIEYEGDRAHVRAVLFTLHVVHESSGPVSLAGQGFYFFDLVRTADGWRIARARNDVFHSIGDPQGRAAAGAARRR